MIEAIIFGLYTFIIFGLVYVIIRLRIKTKQAILLYMQSEFDRHMIKQELERVFKENSNRELLESDGFIKFLSTSRDWAFEYIEQVQQSLSEFDDVIVPIAEWNRTYGNVLGESLYSPKIEEIFLAYEKLKELLPKNNETPNN